MAIDLDSIFASVPKPAQFALAAIGGYFILSRTLNYLRFLASVFVLPGTNLRKYGKAGTWAVVTGASDGVGKEFALQLAAKGFNLVLVSRTQSKLDALALELTTKHQSKKLQTKVLAMDFSRNDNADYERLSGLVNGLDVGILVNNVGASHSIPTPFLLTADEELRNIIEINCLGTLKATQAVVPAMVARKKPGLVLTMGTFAGWTPIPCLATYSGSKAFLQNWSVALAEELRRDKIDVEYILSYLLTGPMSKIRRATALIPHPKPFVAAALAKIGTGGWQNFAYTYTPYWTHAFMLYAGETLLGVGNKILVNQNLKMHLDIRSRALRKAARDAKKD